MSDEIYKPCGYPVLDCVLGVYLTKYEDRIEELEVKLATCEKYRDAYATMERIATQAVRDLDAKLAKAVEALKFYAYVDDDQGYHARTALEEIGEKSDE